MNTRDAKFDLTGHGESPFTTTTFRRVAYASRKWLPDKLRIFVMMALLGGVLSACSGGGGGSPSTGPDAGVGPYVEGLPGWSDFSPRVTTRDEPSGEPTVMDELVSEVPDPTDPNSVSEDVVYVCETTPYTIADNPQELVTFAPDQDVLYPGALIQGSSHRNGIGGLLGLNVPERTLIDISIPELAIAGNTRTVPPQQAQVESARGDIIANAMTGDLREPATGSAISFTLDEFRSEEQFALSAGLSGRYLGYSASASGSTESSIAESTLSLQYIERMYNVVYEAPGLPERFFTEDFTASALQRYVDRGEIGPDSLPVYVASVAYGRMLMFTITSTASSSELRATLQVAYNAGVGGVDANLTTRQQQILQRARISIASVGGETDDVLAIIRSGDWRAYFDDTPSLSTARPLSYTLRNLGDRSIAAVGETTEYQIRECEARGSTGDTFSFRSVQTDTLPVPVPAQPLKGDFDGDGMQDLAWSHLAPSRNSHVVHRSNGDGTFEFLTAADHPENEVEGSWGTYTTHVGDFDNDGTDDLAFTHLDEFNIVYFAYSNRDGTFSYSPEYRHVQVDGWSPYTPLVGNFDGVGGDDIAFNRTTSTANDVHLRVTFPDGSLSGDTRHQAYGGGGWQDYDVFVANVDNDADADLVWNALRSTENALHVARFNGSTTDNLFSTNLSLRTLNGWTNYQAVPGNIDGMNGTDFVFVNAGVDSPPIHRHLSLGNGFFDTTRAAQSLERPEGFDSRLVPLVIDVNGDGRDDVLLTGQGDALLQLTVALGTESGSLELDTRPPQTAPDQDDWSTFTPLALDVDNDGDQDLVYVSSSVALRLYVGIARGGND